MNLDNIGPATKTIVLDGTRVEVAGLSLRKLVQLLGAYPQLAGFVAGGGIEPGAVLAEAPEMAMAIFSLGVRGLAPRRFWQQRSEVVSDDLIAAFDSAAAGRQLDALASIFELTFKGGERALPFLRCLVAAPAEQAPAEPPPSESSPTPSSD